MNRARLARWSAAVGVLLAVGAGVFLVRALTKDWDEVRDSISGASGSWLALALVLAAAGMTAIAVPWRRALRVLGDDLSWGDTVARYYLGELGKYLPGGVWPVLGRGELATRAGVARMAAYGSVALSLAALYLTAMFLVLASLPMLLAEGASAGALSVLVLLPLGVLGLHPAVLERARQTGERVLRRRIDVQIPRWSESLSLLVRYVPAWLCISGGTWAVARAMGQDVGFGEVMPAAILSWIVGFVLVPVPGGIGVREATFVAASGLAPGVGAAVALVARVMFVLVDGVGALLASAWLTRHRTPLGSRGEVAAVDGRDGAGAEVAAEEATASP